MVITYTATFSQNYVWAKSLGGPGNDLSNTLQLDAAGNIYVSGVFSATADFDPSAATATLASGGETDIFIAKYDNNGNYLWAINMGGSGSEYVYAMELDLTGNIYITGSFESTADFDPSAIANNLTSNGQADAFIAKYDNNGNYVWSKSMGSISDDVGKALQLDATGNLYLTGYFYGTVDFDPSVTISNLISTGNFLDVFIAKYDNNGNYVNAKSFGGNGNDIGNSIQLDATGNIYVTGTFQGGSDFDPAAAIANLNSNGGLSDVFVAKYSSAMVYIWAIGIGGSGDDAAGVLQVDAVGNVYISGTYQSTVDFDSGAPTANLISNGSNDIYMAKYDNAGNYVWAKSIGATTNDVSNNLKLDATGNLYLIGPFAGTIDFDPSATTNNLTAAGFQDIFMAKYDALGNFIKAINVGGTASYTFPYAIQTDATGNIYMTGKFSGYVDFDPGPNYNYLSSFSQEDIFIVKFNNVPIGLKEFNVEYENLKIYPNPNNGQFYLAGIKDKVSIEVLDITGNIMLQTVIESANQLIDLSNYAKGLYLLKIYKEGAPLLTKKININAN